MGLPTSRPGSRDPNPSLLRLSYCSRRGCWWVWMQGQRSQKIRDLGGHHTRPPHLPCWATKAGCCCPTSHLPRSKPISTVSGSVFPAPVSLFGDLCLGHREGRLSQFPLGGARPAIEPSRQQEVVQIGCCHGNIDSCPLGRPAVDSNFREYVDHLHQNYLGS